MICKLQGACEKMAKAYNNGNQCTDEIAEQLTRLQYAIAKMGGDTTRGDISLRTFAICSAEATRIMHEDISRMYDEHLKAQENLARLIFTERQGNCPPCPLLQLDLNIPEAQ